jgi:lysophospholipid hydrolase
MIFLAFASTVSWLIRYRYLNNYERLPPGPQRKEPSIDIFPEVPEGDSKRGLTNYLDEFLSAIKVFGYLERPVFHELTRTMQTKKLIAGETILLEEEQGFCLVVDGLVQIFVKSSRKSSESSSSGSLDASDGEDNETENHRRQGYQLLTEVKNGAPMSSLFSILSLFTEDVKLRHEEEEEDNQSYDSGSRPTTADGGPGTFSDLATPADEMPRSRLGSPRMPLRRSGSSLTSIAEQLPRVPPFSLDSQVNGSADGSRRHTPRKKAKSAHPDIVARATRDTTIAIIPATAFRRLTRVYPKASAHIVQVILTRLQRVTLSTGHAYLGLTSEVLRTEKLMNKFTTYDLPGPLRGSALTRLKDKFLQVSLAHICAHQYTHTLRNERKQRRKIA